MKHPDIFTSENSYPSWKTKKFYICQSGWQLYIALELMQCVAEERRPTNKEIMAAIKSIPGDPHPTCKCRDCRYHRMVTK